MKTLIAWTLAGTLACAVPPSRANAPDPGYDQTRDWVVSTITESAGYTADSAVVSYRDVSMDGCQLRFTTLTARASGSADIAAFVVSLDSVNSVLWGRTNDAARGYVLFTTTTPISFSTQNGAQISDRSPHAVRALTSVAAIEFGKANSDSAEIASQMRAALLHASDLCKIQLASK